MPGLRGFRNVPVDLSQWGQWFSAQPVINSEPPAGFHKVTNIYWDETTSQLVVVYESEAET